MKKIAFVAAAAPLALALAACGETNTDETAMTGDDTTMSGEVPMGDAMSDPAMPADPAAARPGETNAQTVDRLDESAENLEERAERVEPTNEAEADRLEAEAERLQSERDRRD